MTYDNTEQAVALAERGFHVFPIFGAIDGDCTCPPDSQQRDEEGKCTSPGKHPKVVGWQHSATTLEERIRQWKWRDTNIGMLTSNMIVIDVDPRSGGDESYERIYADHQDDWPDTLVVRTGSDGTHVVFSGNARNGKIAPGVDIKATGGYIVGPGSHHVAGGEYRIVHDAPIAPAPDWLVRRTRKPEKSGDWVDALGLELIPAGERDVRLTQIAGVFRKRGAEERELYLILKCRNELCVDAQGRPSPLPDEDLRRIAHSIAQKAPDTGLIREELQKDSQRKSAIDRLTDLAGLIDYPPPSWVIDKVWPTGGVNVLWGQPGTMKSFVALEWALCRSAAKDWHGRRTTKAKVLYVGAEGTSGMGLRAHALLQERGWPITHFSDFKFYAGGINLLTEVGQEVMTELIQDNGFTLVIYDTLRKMMTGGDENSTQDVGKLMSLLDEWHHRWACDSLLIHHASKGGTERGSSAIRGDADNIWELQRQAHEMAVTLKPHKLKDADDDWSLDVSFGRSHDTLVSLGAEDAAAEERADDAALDARGMLADVNIRIAHEMKRNDDAELKHIAARLRCGIPTVQTMLAKPCPAGCECPG